MRRLGLLLVVSWAVGARADPATVAPPAWLRVAAPAGWTPRPEAAKWIASAAADLTQVEGGVVGALAFSHPEGGVALYITWVEGGAVDSPELAAQRSFDAVRAAPFAASPEARSAEIVAWREQVDERVATAELEWHHRSNETTTLTRIAIWVTPRRELREAKLDCVMADDRVAARRGDCAAALAALAVTVPEAERGELGAMPGSGELTLSDGAGPQLVVVEPGEAEPAAGAEPTDTPSLRAPAPNLEPGHVLYRGRPASGGQSTRLWYFGAGAALLAVAAYLAGRGRRAAATAAATEAAAAAEADKP